MAHILLVEDDPLQASLLGGALSRAGHHSTWVRHGGQVGAAMDGAKFQAVVTDIFLPEVDGLEVIQRLHATHPQLPVVAMCEDPDHGYLQLAGRIGARAILRKPFPPKELVEALAGLL